MREYIGCEALLNHPRSMLGDEQPSVPPVAQPHSFTQQDVFPSFYLASSPNLHGQINNIPQNNPLGSSGRVNNSSPPPLYGINTSLPSGSASVISITDPRTVTPATTNDTPSKCCSISTFTVAYNFSATLSWAKY